MWAQSPNHDLISDAREELDGFRIPQRTEWPKVPRIAPLVVIPDDLNGLIEHMPANAEGVAAAYEDAARYRFRGVCVAAKDLRTAPSGVKVAALVGVENAGSKLHDTAHAAGADEIDMAIDVDELKAGNYKEVYHDIRGVVQAAGGRTVKVSIETSRLEADVDRVGPEEVKTRKVIACMIAVRAGADFIKTAMDASRGSATVQDVALIREAVGDRVGIVAVGDIRDFRTAATLIGAGADRIGSAHSAEIVNRCFEHKESARLTHAWNSFNYQANQRMQSFQFYVAFIAALSSAYFKVIGNATEGDQIVIAIVGALVSAAFGFLDIRNAELVHCAREALVKLEPEYGLIIRSNEDMQSRRIGLERELGSVYLRLPRRTQWLIRQFASFRVLLKTIYFGVSAIATVRVIFYIVDRMVK